MAVGGAVVSHIPAVMVIDLLYLPLKVITVALVVQTHLHTAPLVAAGLARQGAMVLVMLPEVGVMV